MARRRGNMLEAFQVSREKSLQAQKAAEKAEKREELAASTDSVAQRLQRRVKELTGPAAQTPGPDGFVHVEAKDPLQRPKPAAADGVRRPTRPIVDFPEPGAAAIRKELDKSITLAMGPLGLLASAFALVLVAFWGGYRIGERHGSQQANATYDVPVATASWMDLSPVPQELPDPAAVGDLGPYAGNASADLGVDGSLSEADLAFEDSSNHYTLVVDQHNNNELGWDRALASYQYLQAQGLPAIYPRTRGDVVYLLVGASPDRASLADLLREVHDLAYPGSQDRTFSSAFLERIENFF